MLTSANEECMENCTLRPVLFEGGWAADAVFRKGRLPMTYKELMGEKISALGFGAMRLPTKEDGSIDEVRVAEMTEYAISHGVNYFDTAFPYHSGKSEIVMGKVLKAYPRDSYYLATKYPGHQVAETYDPEKTFEEQLKKCGVEYFDFYLLHNFCEKCFDVYTSEKWGIIPYFLEQRRKGRIRHLGFSSHSQADHLKKILDLYGDELEFCQIQMNYLDWTLQNARKKCEYLNECNMPIWVMEPVRGGKLANVPESLRTEMKGLRPGSTPAEWALRFVKQVPGVGVVLSGMSSLEQMKENVETFSGGNDLDEKEIAFLMDAAEKLKDSVPCTGCRYCCDGCPAGLDIPMLISAYNDAKFAPNAFTVPMMLSTLPEDKLPDACLECGQCSAVCPQKIDVPAVMKDFSEIRKTLPDWDEVCRQRALAAKENRN